LNLMPLPANLHKYTSLALIRISGKTSLNTSAHSGSFLANHSSPLTRCHCRAIPLTDSAFAGCARSTTKKIHAWVRRTQAWSIALGKNLGQNLQHSACAGYKYLFTAFVGPSLAKSSLRLSKA